MAAFSRAAFDTSAFSEAAFDFGAAQQQIIGGGYNPSQGYSGHETRTRTKDDVRLERERLGILPARIIEEVAARQVERLETDAQKQYDELLRELELQGVQFEARYLEALTAYRDFLLNEEIARRLRQNINNEETMMLILIAAAV